MKEERIYSDGSKSGTQHVGLKLGGTFMEQQIN